MSAMRVRCRKDSHNLLVALLRTESMYLEPISAFPDFDAFKCI